MGSENEFYDADQVLAQQEEEYWFPYHYIARLSADGFRQHLNDTWGINYVATIEYVLNRLKAICPSEVVDIGCGDGRLTREIFTQIDASRVLGVDYSSKAISLAKAMNQDLSGIAFECADITADNNFEQFDAAVLMEVFEHIPLDMADDFMRGVHGLIKSGGRLLLTVPHVNKAVEYKHFQHFTVESILAYLKHDFEVVQVVAFEKRGLRRRLLNAMLSNRFFILNNQKILNLIFQWHQKYLFACKGEHDCQRIYVEAIAK